MAIYQWELGIDGSNPPASGTNGTIQIGFANTNSPTASYVQYPANIQAGDEINFVIIDTSTGGSTKGSSSSLTNLSLTYTVANSLSTVTFFTPGTESTAPTQGSLGVSFSFGGWAAVQTFYTYWKYTGAMVMGSIQPNLYCFTFNITADVPATGTMPSYKAKWVRDPEMMVGGWG